MSSYKPSSYNNTTPSENSDANYQHSFKQEHRDVFASHDPRGSPYMPPNPKKAILPRIEREDDEIEVIDSSIPYEPKHPKRHPIKLPNIDYGYPEASVHNFSPGTSVIFNAFKGHTSLLRQPYMASTEDSNKLIEDSPYKRPQSPYTHDPNPEHSPHQHSIYASRDQEGSSSYRQHPFEHSSYRDSHDRQHPYNSDGHPRDHRDYREYQERRNSIENNDPREFEGSMKRPGQRSPRLLYSSTNQGVSHPSRSWTERDYDPQSENRDLYRHRDDYPYPRHSPPLPPPQQHNSGRQLPLPPSNPQNWRRQDSDYTNNHHNQYDPYDPIHKPYSSQSQHHPQRRISPENWDDSMDHNSPAPTPAIDIPMAKNRSSNPYNISHREPMDTSVRNQHKQPQSQSQYGNLSSSVGSTNFRTPLSQRSAGPRYSLTTVQYRMIYEYANEIRDCLIKGKQGTTDRLLYNAEILTKVFMGCRSDIDPNAPPEEDLQPANLNQLHCTSCNIVKTPEWRKGPLGPRTLCNACGLIWGKMSRSKAALIKSKQESASKSDPSVSNNNSKMSLVAGDTDMPEATGDIRKVDGQGDLMEGSSKRRRDAASTNDADSDEALARDEDRRALDVSRKQTPGHDPLQLSSQASLQQPNEKITPSTIKTER